MAQQYGVIESGSWTGRVIDRPGGWQGTVLAPDAPEDDFRAIGLWPAVVEDPGAGGPWERSTGSTLQEDADMQIIRRVVTYDKVSVEERAKEMSRQAKEQFTNTISAGFAWNGVTWDIVGEAREKTRDLVISVASGEGLPNGSSTVRLRDKNNQPHDLDAGQIKALAKSGLDFLSATEDRLNNVLTDISNAETHADLDAIGIGAI